LVVGDPRNEMATVEDLCDETQRAQDISTKGRIHAPLIVHPLVTFAHKGASKQYH
jgi:hypothetical protein